MYSAYKYNVIFQNEYGEHKIFIVNRGTKIKDIIRAYFQEMQKLNLLVNNIENVLFFFDGKSLNYFNENTIESICLGGNNISVMVVNDVKNNRQNYEIIKTIKENIFTSVFMAKIKNPNCPVRNIKPPNDFRYVSDNSFEFQNKYVAIKKIYKDKVKQEMKYNLVKDKITEEEFKPEIEKFNKELNNMRICNCPYSVEIYDFYDTEKEFIIIMELCDETLFDLLCRKPKGFSSKEIKGIFSQLNVVFKKMIENNISHRDIKLNNILVKYLNKEKTLYKVLLSDYGISNQLYSLTQKFTTHAGSQLIMAPEILNDENYTNKCDLWSIGVIIFQLKTRDFPYKGTVEKAILKEIKNKGLTVLDIIDNNEKVLKDLLSKLLVRDPNKRISWVNYFNHQFFK